MSHSRRSGRWVKGSAILAVSLLFMAPVAIMVLGSLRPVGVPPTIGPGLTEPPTAEAYADAFDAVDLARYALNSLFVASLAVPLAVLFASWAGFAISRLPRRAAMAMIAVSVAALMVPVTALLVGRFTLFRTLGVIDTWVPLVVPALLGMSPINVLIYAWAFSRIPEEYMESAHLEGMSTFGRWRMIAMPLVRPVTIGVATLAFIASWGDFISPLIYLSSESLYTLPLGMRQLAALPSPWTSVMMAGAVVSTVPVMVALLVAHARIGVAGRRFSP